MSRALARGAEWSGDKGKLEVMVRRCGWTTPSAGKTGLADGMHPER